MNQSPRMFAKKGLEKTGKFTEKWASEKRNIASTEVKRNEHDRGAPLSVRIPMDPAEFFVHETAAENVWPTGELTADYVCRVDCT